MKTITDAKSYLKANYEKGCECPACGQFVKLYKRKLGSAQSRALILLYQKTVIENNAWLHVREIIKKINITGDFAKLLYWKLIEEKLNDDTGKKNSGYWRLTEMGLRFVLNQNKVPSHVFVYNGSLRGFANTFTSIKESLGKKFNYQELMNNG